MRTFKIIVVTAVLLALAVAGLIALRSLVPSGADPDFDEFADIYNEGSNQEELGDDLYSKTMKQYEGVVKPLGVSIYGEGSHRLEEDDALLAILESTDNQVNLIDFENKEVRVRGTVRETAKGSQKIMDVQYLEVLQEAGVKAFNEVGYEFSFSYPADWDAKKEADKVTFTQENGDETDTLMIVYQYEDVDQPLSRWLQDRDQNLFYEELEVKVGEVTGIRRTIKNGDEEIVKTYAKDGKNTYELRLVSQDEVIRSQYFSIVDFFSTSFAAGLQADEEAQEESDSSSANEDQESPEETPEETASNEEESSDEQDEASETSADPEEVQEDANGDSEASSPETLSDQEPLSSADVDRVLEKGFSVFDGRTISFSYPKIWYFSYLGDGKYGFTDDSAYKAASEEVTTSNSRLFLVSGKVDVSCLNKQEKVVNNVTYTVCARESGLERIADEIFKSLKE